MMHSGHFAISQTEEQLSAPGVGDEVRDFYDRYPYPPPLDNLDHTRILWQNLPRRRADYHLYWPTRPYRENQSILIAGCGTSQAVKHALRWPSARVTAIDFSSTSVRHTEDLKRKYQLANLQVYQLPIERVNELEMRFDQVVCTGVLHHLRDPDAGLESLRSALKPDGAMHLMVYAPYGRAGIYMLQEFARRIGIRAGDDEIADLITALRALPPGHPLESLLRSAPDFRNEAALADALLNPLDRAYSVPQLFEFLKSAGLTFGRWVKQAPYSSRCGVIANLPQAPRLAQLSMPEQYAAIELFRGTMVRHSMVVYRNDFPGGPPKVRFGGRAYLDYVPIRMADTICVEERVPAGAAAVLINQTHTYRDLITPIDPAEKRLFDAIDGTRTIGQIAEETLPASSETPRLMACSFFERLWWSDQVVFDASHRPACNCSIATVA